MQDSIYHKRPGAFKQFIIRIDDASLTVAEALSNYREIRTLTRELKYLTIEHLRNDPNLILKVWQSLREGMAPEAKFKLPFKKKEDHEKQLIKGISDLYTIDQTKAKVRIIIKHYKDPTREFEFNYCLEVVIAPSADRNDTPGQIKIIGCINGTPDINYGEEYFSGENGTYIWTDKHGELISSSGLKSILHHCGFDHTYGTTWSKTRKPCVLYINLRGPVNWYGGAGKSRIDLGPYADDIANTVSKLAYKMPTYHGYGYSSQSDNNSNQSDEDVALNYLRRFLRNRYNEIEKNPGLKNDINYRLNQSGVWYNLRPEMIEAGFEPKKDWGTTRSYIQNSINDVCEELSKEFRKTITREDLNIVASARGIMFFEGQYIPVTIDAIRTLANQGVGIIVIEKSGILELLKDYAQEYGVALIQTQGRFVDYIKDLIEIAKNATAPIATLTDYDIDGITMADETRTTTPRIGIDIDTIEWFNENGFPDLTREDLEEEYSPTRYMESKYVQENEYLKTHRIELDSVIASVGSEAFWNYCKHQLETIFKERGFNYNKVIKPPETINLYPNKITDMISKLENYINKTVEPEWKNIEKDMSNSKELIVVNDKQESNTEELSSKIENDSTMKEKIIPKISNLLEQLTTILG